MHYLCYMTKNQNKLMIYNDLSITRNTNKKRCKIKLYFGIYKKKISFGLMGKFSDKNILID